MRVQRLRDGDGAVRLLAVLEQRDDRAPDRDRRAVERVDVARGALGGAVADVEPPGLEVGRVGGRRELAVAARPGSHASQSYFLAALVPRSVTAMLTTR